jgi:hypothetical protein
MRIHNGREKANRPISLRVDFDGEEWPALWGALFDNFELLCVILSHLISSKEPTYFNEGNRNALKRGKESGGKREACHSCCADAHFLTSSDCIRKYFGCKHPELACSL